MDHLSRLSRLLLAVALCLCFAGPAWAANYVTKQSKYRASGYPFRADVNTACVDAFSAYAAYYLCDGTHTNGVNKTTMSVEAACGSDALGETGYNWDATLKTCRKDVASCPSGTSASTSGECVNPCGSTQGKNPPVGEGGTVAVTGQGVTPSGACFNGCQFSYDGGGPKAWGSNSQGQTWFYVWTGNWQGSGSTCTMGPDVPSTSPPPPITPEVPPGMCPGQVNGQSVVVKCGSTSGTSGTNGTATNADGSTTTTATQQQTQCSGKQCTTTTTTTTTTTPAGGGTGTTTTSTQTANQPQSEFCASNVGDPNCAEEESQWGGSCSAGFTCDGDAVQCAIARDQYVRHCQMFDLPNSLSQAGDSVMTGESRPSDHPANNAESINLGNGFDQTNLIGGSCPPDLSISFKGATVSLPFSNLCGPASWLGNFLVGITALACLGIVFKGN